MAARKTAPSARQAAPTARTTAPAARTTAPTARQAAPTASKTTASKAPATRAASKTAPRRAVPRAAGDKAASKTTAGKTAAGKTTGTKKGAKAPARLDPLESIIVYTTPPHMAEDTEASAVDQQLQDRDMRPGTASLARLPWLRQDRSYRVGYNMLTNGLREAAGHRELEVCNVPALYIMATMALLNTLADGILNDGLKLRHGQTLRIHHPDDNFSPLLGFRRIRPGEHGSDHDVEILRVLFLR